MRLFDEPSLRRLEQLALVAERVRVGQLKGERRSTRRGSSIEFADYRAYMPGDDLRRLDWNVLARIERPFTKLTKEEEDLAIHVLVDTSRSMNWPPPADDSATDYGYTSTNKLVYALRLAGGLGHIALAGGDLLTVTLLDGQPDRHWGPFRSQQNSWRLIEFLEAHLRVADSAHGEKLSSITDLNFALSTYARRARRPGLTFLLTDLFSPAGYTKGIDALLQAGHEVVLLQILSPDEIDPALDGDLKLIDSESGTPVEVTVDRVMRAQYRERLAAWQSDVQAYARQRHVHFVPISTEVQWDTVLLDTMRRQGVVR